MSVLTRPTIVVVGGLFAGVSVVKQVFQQLSPARVILVSPLQQTYNNTLAPRLLVRPELAPQALVDLTRLDRRKGDHDFNLVIGKATSLDVNLSKLHLSNRADPISYDFCVVATGQRSGNAAFKANGDVTRLVESIKEMNDAIKSARRICVVGGGSTGCEVSGEITLTYPEKLVTLVTGDKLGPLSMFGAKIARAAEKRLAGLGVDVVNKLAKVDGNRVTYDGEVKPHVFDLVIPTFGYTPNTDFVPKQYLDRRGYIVVDDHFKVKGTDTVFAIGDCALLTSKLAADVNMVQLLVMLNTIRREMFGENIPAKAYKPTPPTSLVPIGPNGGVGVLWGYKLPSFAVWFTKARDFTIPESKDLLS